MGVLGKLFTFLFFVLCLGLMLRLVFGMGWWSSGFIGVVVGMVVFVKLAKVLY